MMHIKEIVQRINENSRLLSEGLLSEIERDILLDDLRQLYVLAKRTSPAANPINDLSASLIKETKEHVLTVHDTPTVAPAKVENSPVIPAREESIAAPPTVVSNVVSPDSVVKETQTQTIQSPVKAETEEVKMKAASLNEVFAGEEKSLNERHSTEKKPGINDHAGRKDLKNMIDFNKQFMLTNELFNGDGQAFQAAVTRINDSPTIEDAFEYIKTDLLPKYHWSGELQSARLFDRLVRQKFGL